MWAMTCLSNDFFQAIRKSSLFLLFDRTLLVFFLVYVTNVFPCSTSACGISKDAMKLIFIIFSLDFIDMTVIVNCVVNVDDLSKHNKKNCEYDPLYGRYSLLSMIVS